MTGQLTGSVVLCREHVYFSWKTVREGSEGPTSELLWTLQLDHPTRALRAELSGGPFGSPASAGFHQRVVAGGAWGETGIRVLSLAPPGGCRWKKFLRDHSPCQCLSYTAGLSALRPTGPLLAPALRLPLATGSGLQPPPSWS